MFNKKILFLFITFLLSKNVLALDSLYVKLKISDGISKEVFEKAIIDSKKTNESIITIIDFSKKSNKKRLAVIDLENEKLLFNTYVSHGKNSGFDYPFNFSNKSDSFKSSLGKYKTAETYYGKHGYSLKLDGMDKTNSNARMRNIVFHGAEYSSESFLKKHGFLGRSLGCPSVPKEVSSKIINKIKDGTYIYAYK